MAILQLIIIGLLLLLAVFILVILTALPLHFGVKLLNGKSTILKAFLMTFVSQFFTSFITIRIGSISIVRTIIGLIGLFLLILMYREVFKLKWHKALLLWFLYMIFVFIFQLVLGVIIAILPFTIPALSLI